MSFETISDYNPSGFYAVYSSQNTLSSIILFTAQEVRGFYYVYLVRRNLRLREVKYLAQCDTALSVAEVCGCPLPLQCPSLVLVPVLMTQIEAMSCQRTGIHGQGSKFS